MNRSWPQIDNISLHSVPAHAFTKPTENSESIAFSQENDFGHLLCFLDRTQRSTHRPSQSSRSKTPHRQTKKHGGYHYMQETRNDQPVIMLACTKIASTPLTRIPHISVSGSSSLMWSNLELEGSSQR
jgi:hypothetical protein